MNIQVLIHLRLCVSEHLLQTLSLLVRVTYLLLLRPLDSRVQRVYLLRQLKDAVGQIRET